MNKQKVLVLVPRLFSGQEKGQIIDMYNIEEEPDVFCMFGGQYEKVW